MSRASQLAAYLQRYSPGRFAWDTSNCCHLSAAWVEQREGFNPMSGLPRTADGLAAARLLRRLGGLRAAWTQQLKRDPIAPSAAQIGDVVLISLHKRRQAAGICNGRTAAVINALGQVEYIPMTDAVCAWRLTC